MVRRKQIEEDGIERFKSVRLRYEVVRTRSIIVDFLFNVEAKLGRFQEQLSRVADGLNKRHLSGHLAGSR